MGSEQYRSYAADIRASADHLLTLINDILDVSKLEAGNHQVYREAFEPTDLVKGVCRLMQDRCAREGLTLTCDVPAALPRLFADERKIKQVLLNLLTNAAKFTPAGGEIAVEASLPSDGGFGFIVSDNGVGIAPQDMARAFAPFEQIDSQLNRQQQGTGLGLSLSRGFMRLHGGDLFLESSPGQGTTATAFLPESCVVAETAKIVV